MNLVLGISLLAATGAIVVGYVVVSMMVLDGVERKMKDSLTK
ncbi:MAG: hypothetical protein AAGA32_15360 [Pseudomonadota bacterium]